MGPARLLTWSRGSSGRPVQRSHQQPGQRHPLSPKHGAESRGPARSENREFRRGKGKRDERKRGKNPRPPPAVTAARLKDGGGGAPRAGADGKKFERLRRAAAAMAEEAPEDGAVRTLPSLRRLSQALPFGRSHGRLGVSSSGRFIVPAPSSQVRGGAGGGASLPLPCPLRRAALRRAGKANLNLVPFLFVSP